MNFALRDRLHKREHLAAASSGGRRADADCARIVPQRERPGGQPGDVLWVSVRERVHGRRATAPVQFVGESVDGDFAAVQARVATRRGQEAAVIFRLHRRGERWLIYDLSVEGISLVGNYRAQFDQIIQRASYQGLVARIKQRLADAALKPDGVAAARRK